ncbi:MAG: hypothetical protein ACOCZ6_01970 [Nanoarchaeota archaeon]
MKQRLIVLTAFFLVLFVGSVSADELDRRLNISLNEVVYTNITFAEDFDLEKEQPFCEIHGTLNITNPSEDTVFDSYISFVNVETLITDLIFYDGRNATMQRGAASKTLNVNETINDTINNYELPWHLDGYAETDYAYVNSTHFIFNFSSEDEPVGIRFKDGGTEVSIDVGGQALDMEEVIVGSGGTEYGNISINGTAGENELDPENVNITINRYSQSPVIVHVPELRSGNYTTFKYNISCDHAQPPVTIDTWYKSNESDYPDVEKKVLADDTWTITQQVLNDFYLEKNVTNINISMSTQGVTWNDTNDTTFNFTFDDLISDGDYENVYGNGTSDKVWHWSPNGGVIEPYEALNISYNVRAPRSVPETATYLALIENITYDAPFAMSNLTVDEVNASARLNYSEEKRIHSPADDTRDGNVTWEARPEVTNPINISYQLNSVSMWVTSGQDPNEDGEHRTGINKTYDNFSYPGEFPLELNLTDVWSTEDSEISEHFRFNFTDASHPPVVWMKPEWLITNNYGQIKDFSRTVDGKHSYLKYMYVIHGYWLMIDQNITSVGEDQYKVETTVENIGTGWTPENEYVMIYDFVPDEFDAYDFSVTDHFENQSVGIPESEYHGVSYSWSIPWDHHGYSLNSSLGPKRGSDNVSEDTYSWSVSYYVNGTGEYRVTDLYIVGLDPLKVDGASASPVIAVMSGLQSNSKEFIYAGVVAFIIIVNVANLLMTRNINKRIDNASK